MNLYNHMINVTIKVGPMVSLIMGIVVGYLFADTICNTISKLYRQVRIFIENKLIEN